MIFRLGTHNGQFHCDDAMGVAIVCAALPEGTDVEIVRTRDQSLLNMCDAVLDVGGEYNSDRGKYDHHQVRNPKELARENGIPYASAGLIWRHYGMAVCLDTLVRGTRTAKTGDPRAVHEIVDTKLIQPIDAGDTGTKLHDGMPLYDDVTAVTLSNLVYNMNTAWDEPEESPQEELVRFKSAITVCRGALDRAIVHAFAEVAAVNTVLASKCLHNGRVLFLEKFAPWATTVHAKLPNVEFVVFPDRTGTWMAQAVPQQPGSFDLKQPLPEAWAGLRDKDLVTACGVPGAVFCHPGRFICGHATAEGAVMMAKYALLAAV